MRSKDKEKALKLRFEQQLSYSEISKRLNIPKSTLSGWLKDYPLSNERILELQHSEASREKFRNTMRAKREKKEQVVYEKQLKKFTHISEQSLYVAGLMLYLAEGSKKNYSTIGFANTDPEIIRFFVWWLKKYLHIPKEKIRIGLHLYEGMNVLAERKFWQKVTGVGFTQFYKDQIRPLRKGSFSYRESYRHGTCQVFFHGVKEKTELMLSIKAFLDTYSRRGKSPKRVKRA